MDTGLVRRGAAAPVDVSQGRDVARGNEGDQTDVERLKIVRQRVAPDSDDFYYDTDARSLLKRLENVSGVEKRRFCRHNYVYNPVSGRCQASLLVRSLSHSIIIVYDCILYLSGEVGIVL